MQITIIFKHLKFIAFRDFRFPQNVHILLGDLFKYKIEKFYRSQIVHSSTCLDAKIERFGKTFKLVYY